MKTTKRIILAIGCILLLVVSWIVAVTAESNADIQVRLIKEAEEYVADEIYIRAVPLLEEAAGYNDKHTLTAENALKNVYLHLMDKSGFTRKYTQLLEKQMAREDATPDIYLEAAEYYIGISHLKDAFEVLRKGIAKTNDSGLIGLYENQRYAHRMGRAVYEDVGAIFNGVVQVRQDGKWGLASADGTLAVPCKYDQISTFSNGQAIAYEDGKIIGIDQDDNRVALYHGQASDFSNYNENRIGLKTIEGWRLATGEFETGSILLEEIGMFSSGGAPAKSNGKWGVVDSSGGEWIIPAEYDSIKQDELGRCYTGEAVFVEKSGQVLLLVDGEQVGETYDDAKPFADGWAAVKKNGLWGFVDTQGMLQIKYQYDDALSYGQHLAAVKIGETWGYISLDGSIAIEPVFLEAKSFQNGSAPVKTDDGWQFITLVEYEEEAGL